MKTLVRNNLAFLVPYALFLLAAGIVLYVFPRVEIHLFINRHYNTFSDYVFQFFTWAGDGVTGLIIAILLFALHYRYAILSGVSMLLAAGLAQLLKHTLFSGEPRPTQYFAEQHLEPLRHVPGVETLYFDSFPSGHTTQAFALCFSLALMIPNRYMKFFLFVIALCIGYSRMYLSQHFLRDVYAGSLIGTISVLVVFTIGNRIQWPPLRFEGGLLRKPPVA